jgi:hypothetical protein
MFNAENHSIICSKIGGQRTLMSMYSAIVCLTRTRTRTSQSIPTIPRRNRSSGGADRTWAKVIMIKNGAAKVLVCDENSLLKKSSSSKDTTISNTKRARMTTNVKTEQGHSTHRSSSR